MEEKRYKKPRLLKTKEKSAEENNSREGKYFLNFLFPQTVCQEIQAKINEVKVALNNISPALQGDNTKIASVQKVEVVTKQLEQEEQEKSEILEKDSNQLANVIEVFEAPERQGFLSSIFSFVKRLFVGK